MDDERRYDIGSVMAAGGGVELISSTTSSSACGLCISLNLIASKYCLEDLLYYTRFILGNMGAYNTKERERITSLKGKQEKLNAEYESAKEYFITTFSIDNALLVLNLSESEVELTEKYLSSLGHEDHLSLEVFYRFTKLYVDSYSLRKEGKDLYCMIKNRESFSGEGSGP